jgi:hypothetical protein
VSEEPRLRTAQPGQGMPPGGAVVDESGQKRMHPLQPGRINSCQSSEYDLSPDISMSILSCSG